MIAHCLDQAHNQFAYQIPPVTTMSISKLMRSGVIAATLTACVLGQQQPATAAGPEEMADRERVRSEISRAWKAADWDSLDRMGSMAVRQYEKDASSFDTCKTFFYVLPNDNSIATQQAYSRWLARHPQSYAARYARSRYYSYLAMNARGNAYISNTPAEQVKTMEEWFSRAMTDALASIPLSSRPTLSYFQLMRAARYLGRRTEGDKYYQAAVAADPDVLVVASEYLLSLQPRWGGSFEALARFPDQAARQGLSEAKQIQLRREAIMLTAWDADIHEHDEDALQAFRRLSAVASDARSGDIPAFGLFHIAVRRGDIDSALKHAEELAAKPTATADQLVSVAYRLSKAGRKSDAERFYLKSLERDPKHAYALISLANLALGAKRPKDALAYYDRVLGFWPNHAQGLEERARLRITEALDEQGGIKDAEKAAALGRASAQNYLGYLYWEGKGVARNPGNALYWWSQSADRNDSKAIDNLEMAERRLGPEFAVLLAASKKRAQDASRSPSPETGASPDAANPATPGEMLNPRRPPERPGTNR